ncbi:MAG: glutamate--cysteine ligase, partial [Deltaproteobacteria bacterium]
MEHEKFGLLTEDLRPLPYSGPVSIEAVFRILVERFGFEPYYEGEKVVALTHDGTHVSLEPGGQLELSGAVLADNHETCRELTLHRELVHAV